MDGATKPLTAADKLGKNRVLKPNRSTPAARWKKKVLLGLEEALRKDPEANLATLLRSTYSAKLESLKTVPSGRPTTAPQPPHPVHDIRSRLSTTEPCTILSELSPELKDALREHQSLAVAVTELLDGSDVISRSPFAASCMVFRVSERIAAKVAVARYLQEHLPSFPAPRLHGMIRLGKYGLLFSDFVPGHTLEKVWPQLDEDGKRAISAQLDALLGQLRTLPFPSNTSLGSVQGQGCKDGRRFIRISSEPILDARQFEDFIFSGSRTVSSAYIRFLRDLMPVPAAKVVFTHGDIRPANVMVDKVDGDSWTVVAIVDWDHSGFYPEYWECAKMTNNLSIIEQSDWYQYLPESLSPKRYAAQWLIDRVWDPCASNICLFHRGTQRA